jgi:hypothetical protein
MQSEVSALVEEHPEHGADQRQVERLVWHIRLRLHRDMAPRFDKEFSLAFETEQRTARRDKMIEPGQLATDRRFDDPTADIGLPVDEGRRIDQEGRRKGYRRSDT